MGDGCMRHSTPSAAASAVEMETRCSSDDGTLREDLVVRVRDVVPGGLELTLTISNAIGDTPEVSRAISMRDANHDVPEEMSSDANFGVLAGPICETCDDDWIDHGVGSFFCCHGSPPNGVFGPDTKKSVGKSPRSETISRINTQCSDKYNG